MKKIAFILQDLTGGGAERTVANLSFELSKYYEFYIIVFNGKDVSYPHKAKIIDVGLPPVKTKTGKILNVFRRSQAVKQLKRKYKFDIVISFMFSASIVNLFSKCKEITVSSARNYMSAYGMSRSLYLQEKYVGDKSDYVVAISEMVREDLIKNFNVDGEKITTIYNPCDFERLRKYSEESVDYSFDKKNYYYITIGRLVRQKGQWDLLKAFKLVHDQHPEARLIVLGTGEYEDNLKELGAKLGITPYIDFLGFRDNPYAFLRHSDTFVLTSLHEGLGNVVLEAMACGVPVISTDCFAGPREILSPDSDFSSKAKEVEFCEYGVITPEISNKEDFTTTTNENHGKLARAMIKMMEDDAMRLEYKSKAQKRLNDFEPSKISNEWMRLFKMMLEKKA